MCCSTASRWTSWGPGRTCLKTACCALDAGADVAAIRQALETAADVCAGAEQAGAAGREGPGRRFRWLTAPRSTVVQPGPVHTGLTADPEAELDRLLQVLVLPLP